MRSGDRRPKRKGDGHRRGLTPPVNIRGARAGESEKAELRGPARPRSQERAGENHEEGLHRERYRGARDRGLHARSHASSTMKHPMPAANQAIR